MSRVIRYQGAIIRDDHILLVRHREHTTGRSYWIIPGGGREANETEEACVQREILEETHLLVTVERLLLDEAASTGGDRRRKTYLCHASMGEAQPGYEPEPEAAQRYAITEVGWFDLRHPTRWDDQIKTDALTYPLLQKIQAILGYSNGGHSYP